MSGPVLDFDPGAVRRVPTGEPVDTRDAPGVVDTIAAGVRVARDEQSRVQESQLDEAYSPIIDALIERGEGARRGDYAPSLFDPRDLNPLGRPRIFDGDKVWRAIERVRQRDPRAFAELGTREQFELNIRRRNGGRDADLDTLARGSGIAGFVGAVLGEMTDPVNIATLPIGGFGKGVIRPILTEGLINAGIEVVQTPFRANARANLGEKLTAEEAMFNVAAAGVGAAALRGVFDGAPVVFDKARRALDPDLPDKELARAFTQMVPAELRTPEQEAALFIVNRSEDIRAANPYVDTLDALDVHVGKMQTAMDAIEEGRIAGPVEIETAGVAPVVRAPVTAAARGIDLEAVKAAIRGPESGGNDRASNAMGSSAAGRYQFIRSTFVSTYAREYGVSEAAAARAWETSRFDVTVQERLMDRLTLDNAAALERAGIAPDPGNLYLAHFAGSGKAIELLRVDPDLPVAQFFSKKAIAQNPTYLGGGKTVGEAIEIIRTKVGDPGERSPVPLAPDNPPMRDPALDAERPVVMLNNQPIGTATFRASQIGVDAELMQFKSGGDQFGVTDRLRSVEEWDSYQAGFVTVWEALDGRRLIADGHQRHGLATRIGARTGQDIELNAYVLREADGITAADARRITALRNVAEGSGTKTDAAKVFRDLAPEEIEAVMRRMAKGGEFIRDARGLARLEAEAFGAIINDVLPENYGAAIGQMVDDPALHMGMVRVLADTQPANRRQAEAIIRQALDAGFVRETQDSLFGPEDLMTGLFAQRAKLLDRALSELKRLKGAFGVAVRNAETLEAGGNVIDVAGSAAEVDANARALALVNALALRKGNAVNDLLTRAAERIAAGERPADVLRQFVADVRKLDLDDIAQEADDVGGRGAGDGAGRSGSDAADEAGFVDDGPGLFGDEPLTPREIDELAAARPRSDHSDLPPDPDPKFADVDSPGIVAAADSAWHDIRQLTEADPNIAARQRTEAQLGAEAPMRARVDQDGEMGLGLFDAVDQQSLFDLGDGRGERSIADIRAEIDGDRSMIDTLRSCMT